MIKKFIIIILLFTSTICASKSIKWKQVFQADNVHFIGIDNSDSNYCMALATNVTRKVMVKSTDGGETWFYAFKDSTVTKWKKEGENISYPSHDFCIISLDSNSFLKSVDGGNTWNEYQINLPYYLFGFDEVDMFDENNGVMKQQHYLAISHDGFQTWDTILAPGGYYVFNVAMATSNSICVISRDIDGSPDFNERFYRSDDGGNTWNEYPHPDYRIPQALQFVDSLTGYEVGGESTGIGQQRTNLVFKTTDGGHSWEEVMDTVIYISFGLQKLDFYDKDNGIVVGQFGSVFWTHDGGQSWIFDSCGLIWDNIPATMNVCYIRKNRAIVADYNGRIFISSEDTTDVVDNTPQETGECLLYPNPASNFIRIKLPITNYGIQKIFNSFGQEIEGIKQKRITENEIEFDVSKLPAGAYFAVIKSKEKIYSKPFVVLR